MRLGTDGVVGNRVLDNIAPGRIEEARRKLWEQGEELEALQGECERLEAAIAHEQPETVATPDETSRPDGQTVQQLLLEHEVQTEEIGHLQQILQRQRSEAPARLPGAGVLQNQVDSLQAELLQLQQKGAHERCVAEQQVANYRQEKQAFQSQLQRIASEKGIVERELWVLRQGNSSVLREHADQQMCKEAAEKEMMRTKLRIDVCDAKIQQLREEAADIRQRASFVLDAAPVSPTGSDERVYDMYACVRERQEQLQLMKHTEDELRKQKDDAQQAFEAAKVQAGVIKQKMQLLRSRNIQPHD